MTDKSVEFYGGWVLSLVPMAIFIIACTLCFVVLHVFDMNFLSMCAFLAIIVGESRFRKIGQGFRWRICSRAA
jgi:hypothetical protein